MTISRSERIAELMAKRNQGYTTVERGIERYETESGKRYRVRWKDASGVYRSQSVPTLKEARKVYAQNIVDKTSGNRIGRTQSVRVLDFAEGQWLDEQASEKEEAGLLRDLNVLDRHVIPYFGDRWLSEIDTQDIAAWKSDMLRRGVGAPTVRIAMKVMNSIMNTAAIWHRDTGVTINPVMMVKRPSGRRTREPTIWHPIVTARLAWILGYDSVRQNIDGDYPMQDALLVSLCSMAGLRPGEAIALKWSDIQNGQIFIKRAVSLKTLKDTKTFYKRTVPLLSPLADDLNELKQFRAGKKQATRFVFENNGATAHWDRNAYRNFVARHLSAAVEYLEETWSEFATALEQAGMTGVPEDVDEITKARLYDLGRHSHSALMLSCSTPLIKLSQIQGHSIKTLSDNYAQYMAGLEHVEDDPETLIDDIRDQVVTVSEEIRPEATRRDLQRRRK
jgi:integrase